MVNFSSPEAEYCTARPTILQTETETQKKYYFGTFPEQNGMDIY